MANNIPVVDQGGATKTIKTTDTLSVHTPHHNVDAIAPGASADIGAVADPPKHDEDGSLNSHARSIAKDIHTRIPDQGQALMDDCVPVVIASNQTTLPISGTVLNGGPSWTQVITATSSADMSGSEANITPVPTSGEHTVIESITVSAAVAMIVTITEETTGLIIKIFNLTAGNLNAEWNPANGVRLPQADKKLQGLSDTPGQVDITVISHSAS